MAATDARPVPIKNTAFRAYFALYDNDGDPVAAAAGLDSEVSIDGAAFTDCTNEATAVGQGVYYLDLTAGEMNGDAIAVLVKTSTTDAKATLLVFYPQESGDIKVDVQSFGGSAGTFASGRPEVNATHAAGTAWGAGAITAGAIAAAALNGKGDWNIGKTGYALSAAGVQAVWDALTSALSVANSVGKLLVDNLNAAVGSRSSHSAADVWAAATRTLTAGTNIVLAKGTGVTGFTDLDAAGIRAAVGLAAANLDTQLAAIDNFIDDEIAELLADTSTTLDDLVDDLEGRLTAALATKLAAHAAAVLAVVVGSGSTTTAVKLSTVEGAAPSTVNDFYNSRVLVFTSGALAGQAVQITDYDGAITTATISGATAAPANAVTAVIC